MKKNKADIRNHIRACKALLSAAEKMAEADDVFSLLEKTAAFTMATRVLMYHSLPDELPTRAFLDRNHSGKEFFLPRVNGMELEILPYDKSRLHLGSFHIEEPDGDLSETVDADNLDVIVVPAVAFDRHGNRVGRGKGYYDRLLATSSATKIGVGFSFQLLDDDIDAEEHDIPLDIVITPRGTIVIKHKNR